MRSRTVARFSDGRSPPTSSMPSSPTVSESLIVPLRTYLPYSIDSTLFRHEAMYETSATSPYEKITCPPDTTMRPVVPRFFARM